MAEEVIIIDVELKGADAGKKVDDLTQSIVELEDANKRLRKEQNKTKGNTTEALAERKKLGVQIEKNKDQLKKLRKERTENIKVQGIQKNSLAALRKANSDLKKQIDQVDISNKKGRKAVKAINKEIDKNTKIIKKNSSALARQKMGIGSYTKSILGAAGLVGGLAGLFRAFKNTINIIKEFQSAQSELLALSGKTRKELKDLTKQAKQLGGTTEFTATQVTKLQTELVKLGFATTEIRVATKDILNFASATGAELSDAAKVAGIALRVFDMDASRAAEVTSTLAVATTKSALAFSDYETILSTVGPVAKAYGFTLQDTIALTGKLRDAGFDASSAATATRNILLNLADTNGALAKELGGNVRNFGDLTEALKELDDRGIDLASTLELTDKRSVAAFNQFLTGAESANTFKESIIGVNDELQEMVDKRLDNLAGDVTKLSSAWEGFVLKAEGGANIFREAIKFANNAILEFSNMDLFFKRASKWNEDQAKRSYDILFSLNKKYAKSFVETTKQFNKIAFENVAEAELIFKKELKEAGFNRAQREVLWDEYLIRRKEQNDLEAQAEADRILKAKEQADKEAKILAQKNDKLRKFKNAQLAILKEYNDEFNELLTSEVGLEDEIFADALKSINELDAEGKNAVEELEIEHLDRLNEALQINKENRIELIDDENEYRREVLNMQMEMEIAAAEKVGADTSLIQQKYAKINEDIARQERDAKLAIYSSLAGSLAQLFGENTKLGKAAAIIQTTIDTYRGAMSAFAQTPGGIIIKTAASAAAIAQGLAAVKKIKSTPTKLAKGGEIEGASHAQGGVTLLRADTMAPVAEVEGKESLFVVNKYDTPLIDQLSEVNSIHGKPFRKTRYAQDGGEINTTIDTTSMSNSIIEAIKNVQIVVGVRDIINETAQRARVVQNAEI